MSPQPPRLFTHAQLDELATTAQTAVRGRAHLNIHASAADALQRFFVVAQRRSYFRPHRHHTRAETVVVIRGAFDVLTFDDAGVLVSRWAVGEGTPALAYEMAALTWHMLLARVDGSALLEMKEGPYDPEVAAEFAGWAPVEGEQGCDSLLQWARTARPGDAYLGLRKR